MKKFLIGFLLSCSCALTMAAVACGGSNGGNGGSSDAPTSTPPASTESVPEVIDPNNSSVVTFVEGEGFSYISQKQSGDRINNGSELRFTVDVGGFYTGTPVVYVNDTPVASVEGTTYSVTVTEDVTVRVEGLRQDVSNMDGMGTMDSPFLVSRPIDLIEIAKQVNAGNRTYTHGSYLLVNDIDCKGEELEVIGNSRIDEAVFSGCFSVNYDSETGERYDYKISNFTINSDDSNYVGLFGTVVVDLSTTSSGLFYGIKLDNFHISASLSDPVDTENRSISCGALIGYGIGATLRMCDATNGVVDVYADDSYFAFAGGLIGYQQAFFASDYGMPFPSEIAYSVVDVDVRVLDGVALYAGGISGYLATNYPMGSAAYIHHSYATGTVSGALRTGGIAGGLGQYTSVSNCYATGDVIAKCGSYISDGLMASEEYCMAHAGGLVGYAENDTIVNDSFAANKTYAYAASGKAYQFTSPIVGGGYEAQYMSAVSEKYVVWNCLDSVDVNNITDLETSLEWMERDWILEDGSYPTINYANPTEAETTEIALKFVSKETDGGVVVNDVTERRFTYLDLSQDAYAAIGDAFYTGSLGDYKADNGFLSYGYYLDEDLQIPLPYSYISSKDLTTLYVAFADVSKLVGTYDLIVENANPLTVTFKDNGTLLYSDGRTEEEAYYYFDGKNVSVFNSRLTRYYMGEIVVDDTAEEETDPYFDINRYVYGYLKGELINGEIALSDGTYFTAENPLVLKQNVFRGAYYFTKNDVLYQVEFYGDKATLKNGVEIKTYNAYVIDENDNITLGDITVNKSELEAYDAYKGTWTKSATLHKSYVFDGMGGWKYYFATYNRNGSVFEETLTESASGTYTLAANGDIYFIHGGVNVIARFDEEGALHVSVDEKSELYYRGESYVGEWSDTTGNVTLTLYGIGKNGYGYAFAEYASGYNFELLYELSETDGYVTLYNEQDGAKVDVFGYFTYNVTYNVLSATLFDPTNTESTYTAYSLLVTDDYVGEWICNAPGFENIEFNFNGNALYEFLGAGRTGSLTIKDGDTSTVVNYTLDSTLSGKFAYNGTLYTITFDETEKTVTLTSDTTATLERKDIFANVDFVDLDGNRYAFDGKSNLTDGGKLVINGSTEYIYKPNADGGFDIYANETLKGSIVETDATYALTIDGKTTDLYYNNEFIGDWAVNGMFKKFSIGPTDKNNAITATFDGKRVIMTYSDVATLTFKYVDQSGMPYQYYLFLVDSETIALSEYSSLYGGEYSICSRVDELFGTWEGKMYSIAFDGVQSDYVRGGTAKLTLRGSSTYYYYIIREGGIMMWSQTLLNGKTTYFKIEYTDDKTAANAYVQGDRAIIRTEVDALFLSEVTDANGVRYVFDGMTITGENGYGTVTADNGKTYAYKVTSYNTNNTADLILIDKETNVEYSAVLDYRNSADIKIKISEKTE